MATYFVKENSGKINLGFKLCGGVYSRQPRYGSTMHVREGKGAHLTLDRHITTSQGYGGSYTNLNMETA